MQAEENLSEFFGPGGALEKCLNGFAPRPEQLAMAREIADAITAGSHLVIEAGTGTGKTLAYLVPALLSGRQVIISTGTRTLQDQLYHRDLPTIGAALGRPVTVQLLKGRSNYLCRYRLDGTDESSGGQVPDYLSGELRQLKEWAAKTRTGDISEFDGIPENSSLWPRVTSTVDNCLGARCARYDDCHVIAARQAAREADLVVVNHHLLMADLTMKEEGFGDLLPGADTVIVDEAHNFPGVAQGFFNKSLGAGQIDDLIGDTRRESVTAGVHEQTLEGLLDKLRVAAADAKLALPGGGANLAWVEAGEAFAAGFSGIAEALVSLRDQLDEIYRHSVGLARCRDRASAMIAIGHEIQDTDDDVGMRWVRPGHKYFTANVTPLDSSAEIAALMGARACTWIFTSATLAVKSDFSHFTTRLGIEEIATRQIPSPFAYPEITRLYLPVGLPAPSAFDYTDRAVEVMATAVEASRGRAFLLFTSHRALQRAAEVLTEREDFDYPLLVQGTAPRSRLLEQFSHLGNAVLLGTSTFWEGVDIRGHDLILVAIDRLPFASPGDPMLAAQLEAIRNHGGNPFRDYQLPQAVISLKQGVGRLIRDYDDYGVVMVCDPRIVEKSYGRTFISSLPPMPIAREIGEIEAFFAMQEATKL
jgi:ATP-dependent DNA helicase DinG